MTGQADDTDARRNAKHKKAMQKQKERVDAGIAAAKNHAVVLAVR